MRYIHSGFNLLELLICISIISLLAAISVPAYQHYFLRANRLEAAQMLSQLAIALEQYQLEHHTYAGGDFTTLHIPEYVANQHYQLKIRLADATTYEVQAIPQANQIDPLCGALILKSTGEKSISGNGDYRACW